MGKIYFISFLGVGVLENPSNLLLVKGSNLLLQPDEDPTLFYLGQSVHVVSVCQCVSYAHYQ